MRVHRLEITAFGPFPGTEMLDFEPLNAAGVFLLTGQTGAGKTSVLDAICFGLFGQVPGVRDKAKIYRSQHAPEGRAPRVVLDVTLRGRRLRIARSPAWARPSRRAKAGAVDEKARATVEELVDGSWVARSARADEVGHLVTGLLGLNRDQFCQVVMLAQGEFQTFLRAGGRDRQSILETLFGMQRFQAIERWLVEHRRQQSRRYQEHADALQTLDARLREVCSPVTSDDLFALPDEVTDFTGLLSAARQLAATGSAAADDATERLEHALLICKQAQHAYDDARSCADLRRRHAEALRRHDELAAAVELVDSRERQLVRARAADALIPLVHSTAEAAAAADAATTAAEQADASYATADPEWTAESEAGQRVGDLQERISMLSELLVIERDIDEANRRIVVDDAARALIDERLAAIESELRAQPAQLAGLSEALRVQEEQIAAGTHASAGLAGDEAALTAAREAATLDTEAESLLQRRLVAHARALEATEVWLAAKERLLTGVAAELARRLGDGDACPVCGSRTHPEPATAADDHVSSQDEAGLYVVVTQARVAVDELDRQLAMTWERRADALRRSGGSSVEQAAQAVEEARAAMRDAAKALTERVRLTASMRAAERLAVRQQEEFERDSRESVRLEERVCALRRQATSGRARIESAAGEGVRVAEALAATRRLHILCRAVDTARRDREQVQHAADSAAARLAAELADSTFDSSSAVLESALTTSTRATLESLNRAHAAKLEACLRDLRDPVLVSAAAAPPPDLEALEIAARLSTRAAAGAESVASAVSRRQVRLEELLAELNEGVHELEPLRAAKETADAVAGLCCGSSADNATRTALSHYVLAARLAQVVAAANVRLDGICGGRYQLEHTTARSAGDSRGGLGLVVHDAHTDRSRDPATLSGGETFYVSLSLALGLADVVTSEAGGAELATLFVDEGFGALDDETREEVLDALDALRTGGRTIGLVSHLPELRARIPTQLHVLAGPRGSTCSPVTTSSPG